MKKVLLFISMLLAAVLITGLYSCTQDGGENDSRHQRGNDVNLNLKKACESLQKVDDIYMECSSIEDLQERAEEISQIEEVQDVYFSNTSMFVEVKDFITVSFSFYPELEKTTKDEDLYEQMTRQMMTRSQANIPVSKLGFEKAVIVDQQLDRKWGKYEDHIVSFLNKAGIETIKNTTPTINFYEDEIYEYDIVLIISHGSYDPKKKIHWLNLGNEEFFDRSQYHNLSFWDYVLNLFQDEWYYKGYLKDDQLRIDLTQQDIENGTKSENRCFSISENFLTAQTKNFKKQGKAIVFNCACQSVKGGSLVEKLKKDEDKQDFAFADAFIQRGAGVYFGYDEYNKEGQTAGMMFLGGLASGLSVLGAYNSLPDDVIHDYAPVGNALYPKVSWTADLFHYPLDHFDIEKDCQVSLAIPITNETETEIILNAKEPYHLMDYNVKTVHNNQRLYTFYYYKNQKISYGFEYSINSEFSPSNTKTIESLRIDKNTKIEDHTVSFSYSIPKSDLNPETTYYYRAYLDDGTYKYYSDYDEFTTPKQERIDQVIPEDIREQMEPFIPIYDGNNPPTIEGVFVIDSPEVVHDTTNNYKKGDTGFTPIYLRFLNQDFMNNTLDYEERDVYNGKVVGESSGPGAFISGEGNNFSVFFSTTGVNHYDKYDISVKTSLVISGTKTDSGIKDVRYAFVLTDKGADPDHHVMDKGGFRVFKDSDDFASKATWPSGARSWGWDYHVKDGKITTPWSIYAVRK